MLSWLLGVWSLGDSQQRWIQEDRPFHGSTEDLLLMVSTCTWKDRVLSGSLLQLFFLLLV